MITLGAVAFCLDWILSVLEKASATQIEQHFQTELKEGPTSEVAGICKPAQKS